MNKDDALPKDETPQDVSQKYETLVLRRSQNGKIILIYADESRNLLTVETIIFEWNNGEPLIHCSGIDFDRPTANKFTDALCDTLPYLKK
jgi:hypothetical protein